jgi:pseudouridine synthase
VILLEGQQRDEPAARKPATGADRIDPGRPVAPVVVVHEARRGHALQSADTSLSAPFPKAVLSPLAPGDSGLQLLSHDLDWLNRAAPVLRRLPVTYRVRLARAADAALVARLQRGVTDFGEFLAAARARLVEDGPAGNFLEITLNHGRSTTVRRLFSAFGLKVLEVHRTAVGPIQLGTLSSNERRSLTEAEYASLPGSVAG